MIFIYFSKVFRYFFLFFLLLHLPLRTRRPSRRRCFQVCAAITQRCRTRTMPGSFRCFVLGELEPPRRRRIRSTASLWIASRLFTPVSLGLPRLWLYWRAVFFILLEWVYYYWGENLREVNSFFYPSDLLVCWPSNFNKNLQLSATLTSCFFFEILIEYSICSWNRSANRNNPIDGSQRYLSLIEFPWRE